MEKTESKCWVRDSCSNRPTEGEINKHFPNPKEDRKNFSGNSQLFQQHSTTFRKKITPRLKKQSNFRKCLTPKEKLVAKLR